MEFKKLSAVEMVETVNDAAHVLIEENGVVKRAPKDEVGGIKVASAEVGQTIVVKAVDGNGVPTEWECADMSKWDAIVYVTSTNAEQGYTFELVSGSHDELRKILISEDLPRVKIIHRILDANEYYITTAIGVTETPSCLFLDDGCLIGMSYGLNSDNTMFVD